jgi:DNA-binding IclR family transcriptional regulator
MKTVISASIRVKPQKMAAPAQELISDRDGSMATEDASPGPLARYIDVLEIVVAFSGSLTLADVSSILELPKTTAHRLLKGLVRSGLATEGEGGRTYHAGDRLTRLLHASADEGWFASLAGPHLRALTETSTETCYLARLVGSRVVVAISQSPDVRWRGYVQPGIEMPVNAAATGKAIMAYQSKALIAEALAQELPKPTVNSRNSRKWIEQEFAKVRKLGYATCIGEIDEGLAAIAVPVTLPGGAVLHSVGMTGPLERIMNKQLPERLAALNETAAALAKALSAGARIKARTV